MEFKVVLNSPEEVKEFVKAASQCDAEIDLKSGSIYLDAKSLLGVLSMGIKKELKVMCVKDDEKFFRSGLKILHAMSAKYVAVKR